VAKAKGLPPGMKSRYFRGQVDIYFLIRNWRAINETPIKKAGLLIRTIMRGKIRRARYIKKKGVIDPTASKPGQPPKARYGIRPGGVKTPSSSIPFKKILSIPFESGSGGLYKHKGSKAVIGHVRLPIKQQDPSKTPMEAHEFGRRVIIKKVKPSTVRRRARTEAQRRAARRLYLQGRLKQKKRKKPVMQKSSVKMPKRPFAYPSLLKAKSKIGNFWKDRIRRGKIKSSPLKV